MKLNETDQHLGTLDPNIELYRTEHGAVYATTPTGKLTEYEIHEEWPDTAREMADQPYRCPLTITIYPGGQTGWELENPERSETYPARYRAEGSNPDGQVYGVWQIRNEGQWQDFKRWAAKDLEPDKHQDGWTIGRNAE